MYVENRFLSRVNVIFPFLLLLVAISGLSFTVYLGRTDLTLTSLVFVVPMFFAAVILFKNRSLRITDLTLPVYAGRIQFSHLFLINCIIFTISLILLVSSPTRPLAYFILVSLYSGILLLQIFCRRSPRTDFLIVLEILFLSLSLIWGVSLKYPLYFGDTDSLIHLRYIDIILTTGHIQNHDVTYLYYPLYHIFNAVGIEITGLSISTALFLFMGITWQAGILFSYLIFRSLTGSSKIAAIACLLLASSSQIIFYGSYSIARSLSFVFFLGWLFLVISKPEKNVWYLILSFIVMAAMILTHHVNVILIIPLLLLVYLCQIFYNRFRRNKPFEPLYIYLFAVCVIGYLIWFAPELSNTTLISTIRAILGSDMSIMGDITAGYGPSVIIGIIYYSFVLLLCLLGLRIIFGFVNPGHNSRIAGAFALAGFFMLIVYLPGPLDLLSVSGLLMTSRFNLIVSPFIALLMAYGIYFLLKNNVTGNSYSSSVLVLPVFTAGFVAIMTFFSTVSTGNAQDYDNFPHTSTIDTPYFTHQELKSFTFLRDQGNNTLTLYSDYQTRRNDYILGDFATRRIIQDGDISYIHNGYLVLRSAELERKHALTFSPDGFGATSYRYKIDPLNPENNIIATTAAKNRVYSNGNVQVFAIYPGKAP
jgi:hypothetical protein